MAQVLKLLHLSDRYEIKARLLPGLLSVAVLLPGAAAAGVPFLDTPQRLALGVGFGVVLAVALAHAASAAGNRLQRRLWPRWPFDSPTHRYLHPDDRSCSEQQKAIWYEAIRGLLGLDIPAAATSTEPHELELVINDAVRFLRHRFRSSPHSGLLQIHNEDYGFARNLAGLRSVWFGGSLASTGTSWSAWSLGTTEITWPVVSSLIAAMAVLALILLPGYVRAKANTYADSFVAMLTSEAQRINSTM